MHRLSAFYLLLFHNLSAVLAQLQVQLNFYTDLQCQTPSTEHAGASIPISECIVTPGLGSLSHKSVPCKNGNVNVIGYRDTSCGTALDVSDIFNLGDNCIARFEGDIAAILLTCNQEDDSGKIDPGTPTITSTIVVGQVADSGPTATQSVASISQSVTNSGSVTATHTASSSSPSVTNSGGVTATPTASASSPSSSSNGSGSGTGNGAGGNSKSSSSSSSGLSTSDIISIAVGLGVGIPTILIGLWGLRRHRRNQKLYEDLPETKMELSSNMNPPPRPIMNQDTYPVHYIR